MASKKAEPLQLQRDETRLSPQVLAALAVAVLVAAALRFRGLGRTSLWTDELVSWWAASGEGLGEVISRCVSCMATPPLSFLVEHVSVRLAGGASEWALRLPSALAGVAAVVVIFAAGRRMFGNAAGLAAAFLLAVHPVHLWFSTDARPYSLAVLLAAGSTWALSELLRSGGNWRAVAAYAVLTAGLLHAQFIFVPFVLAQVLTLLLAGRCGLPRPPASRIAAALGGAALLALPLAPQVLSVAGRASSLTWPFRGQIPPGVFAYFQTTPLAVAMLLTGALWLTFGRQEDAGGARAPEPDATQRVDLLALALAYLVPAVLLSAAALGMDLPTLLKPRYLVASLAPCVLLVGWLLTRLAWKPGRWLLTLTYLALVFAGDLGPLRRGESFNVNARNENWSAAAQIIQDDLQPGDLVLLRGGLVETDDLFRGSFPEACEGYLAATLGDFYMPARPEIVLLPQEFDATIDPGLYRRRIGEHLAGRQRIWFVMVNPSNPADYYSKLARYISEVAGRPYRVGGTGDFVYVGQVTLVLLEATT